LVIFLEEGNEAIRKGDVAFAVSRQTSVVSSFLVTKATSSRLGDVVANVGVSEEKSCGASTRKSVAEAKVV